MSKAYIAGVIRESAGITNVDANRVAGEVIEAIVDRLKTEGGFTLPRFGKFVVRKTKARRALNPRTDERIRVRAGRTVRFKASPTLRSLV